MNDCAMLNRAGKGSRCMASNPIEKRAYLRFLESVLRGDRATAFYHLGRLDAWGAFFPYASFSTVDHTEDTEVLKREITEIRSLLEE
jgi:hypothetical protein